MDSSIENQNDLTASGLKAALWDTLKKIKAGQVDPGQADSVATQAREILRTTSVQLKIAQQTKRQVPAEVILFSES